MATMRWNEEHVLTAQGLDGIALRSSLLYGGAGQRRPHRRAA